MYFKKRNFKIIVCHFLEKGGILYYFLLNCNVLKVIYYQGGKKHEENIGDVSFSILFDNSTLFTGSK